MYMVIGTSIDWNGLEVPVNVSTWELSVIHCWFDGYCIDQYCIVWLTVSLQKVNQPLYIYICVYTSLCKNWDLSFSFWSLKKLSLQPQCMSRDLDPRLFNIIQSKYFSNSSDLKNPHRQSLTHPPHTSTTMSRPIYPWEISAGDHVDLQSELHPSCNFRSRMTFNHQIFI